MQAGAQAAAAAVRLAARLWANSHPKQQPNDTLALPPRLRTHPPPPPPPFPCSGGKELVRDGQPVEALPLVEQGLQLALETGDLRGERALVRVRARALRESGGWVAGWRGWGEGAQKVVKCVEHCAAFAADGWRVHAQLARSPCQPPPLPSPLLMPLRACRPPAWAPPPPPPPPPSAAAAGDPSGALRDLQRSVALSTQLGEASGDADTLGEMGDLLTGGWVGGWVAGWLGGWVGGSACCCLLFAAAPYAAAP